MSNIVAIRSLCSEHHAENLVPSIIDFIWNIGKRCNYDCSYCPPTIHDWVSPHVSLDNVRDFFVKYDQFLTEKDKQFKLTITGGEPFVHPNILDILKIIRSCNSCHNVLSVTSNGSVPLTLYEKSLEFVSNLTISLHFERGEEEINGILNKVLHLNKNYTDRFINVQLMAEPGQLDLIKNKIIPFLENNNIKFAIRRIKPWTNEAVDEFKDNKRKVLRTNFSLDFQSESKKKEKEKAQEILLTVYKNESFYTKEELEWLETTVPKTRWTNMAVWDKSNNYFELNSDELVSTNRNSFNGWVCYAGVDEMFVDFDGEIYRGLCQNAGPIGSIYNLENFDLCESPTICEKNFCLAFNDIVNRKAHPDFLHLINTDTK